MRKEYNKLIRDRIPEIIQASGKECAVETLSEAEFRVALLEKLLEEAREVREADPAHIQAELADLQEVMDEIALLYGLSRATITDEQARRREERGGFKERLNLLWTT